MPNWVYTNMKVMGDHDTIQRFHDGINMNKGILESYIPCPQELRDTVSGWTNDEEVQAEREKQYRENLAKHGYESWYDWQHALWGVKWGDDNTHTDGEITKYHTGSVTYYGMVFDFATPWAFAERGFLTISQMFPSLVFDFEVREEGGHFAGFILIKNGEVLFEETFSPADCPFEASGDEHDLWVKQSDWEQEQMDSIEARMPNLLELL